MIPALTPTPRYREHVAAVDKRSALKNVLGALGLLLLAMLAGSLVAAVGDLLGDSENDLVTPVSAVTVALQLAIAAFVFRRAWHITSRDLGFVKEGVLGSWLVGARGGNAAITIVWGANHLLGGVDFSPKITASGKRELAQDERGARADEDRPQDAENRTLGRRVHDRAGQQREDALDGVVDVDAVLGDVVLERTLAGADEARHEEGDDEGDEDEQERQRRRRVVGAVHRRPLRSSGSAQAGTQGPGDRP